MSHRTIDKKYFVNFSFQKHSHNLWLAFTIPQHPQLRKSMLGSAKYCGFGAAESRVFQSMLIGCPLSWNVLSHLLL